MVLARGFRTAALGIAAALALVGCSGAATRPTDGGTTATGFPISVSNCGTDVTVAAPPRRAIVIGPAALELVQAIDALPTVSAVVGIKGRPTKYLSSQAQNLRSLKDKVEPSITQEALIAARPDMIIDKFDGHFTANEEGLRSDWSARGVPTFVPRGGCSEANSPDYTVNGFLADIRTLGAILGRKAQAAQLADQLQARIDKAVKAGAQRPVNVFIFDSGEDTPGTLQGRLLGDLIGQAGGKDIFSDLGAGYHEVSWEQVAARNPDAIIAIDYSNGSGDDGAQKIQFLRLFPALAGTRAVRNGRIMTINLESTSPSITMVGDLERMAGFFDEIGNS